MAVYVDINRCNGCGVCVDMCPVEAIKLACPVGPGLTHKETAVIDEQECTECGLCSEACPNEAIIVG